MTTKVFVYGTLKDASRRDDMYVKGTLFDLGAFPGIKLEGVTNVPGQIVEVTEQDLEILDRYEGVSRGLYTRKKTWAYPKEKENLFPEEVWIYEFAQSVDQYSEIDKW